MHYINKTYTVLKSSPLYESIDIQLVEVPMEEIQKKLKVEKNEVDHHVEANEQYIDIIVLIKEKGIPYLSVCNGL